MRAESQLQSGVQQLFHRGAQQRAKISPTLTMVGLPEPRSLNLTRQQPPSHCLSFVVDSQELSSDAYICVFLCCR